MNRAGRSLRSRGLFLLTCAPLWGGCASLGTLETADTVPKGQSRLTAQAWVQGVDDGRKPGVLPQVAVAGRAGVTEGLDVGGRLSLQGAEGSLKLQLAGREEGSPFVMSVAPTAGVVLFSHAWEPGDWSSDTQLFVAVPLLFALRNPDGSQLVLGLRPTWMRFDALFDPESREMAAMGASLGYAFRVNPGLRVMPEAAMLLPVADRQQGQWARVSERPQLQFGIAFLMDPVR
ncbi:MAG TPA: hypothetical protein VFZ09_21950 [Archangium sp.]|uniref:hypothetical protein n=1 Tax=Archangium sp. TaxID=1872627 RepID=UPI002E33EBE2|nr:hypothetical protein [Archangium sp.]HEX5748919.1 hypothetical protein [Archangium sp.]